MHEFEAASCVSQSVSDSHEPNDVSGVHSLFAVYSNEPISEEVLAIVCRLKIVGCSLGGHECPAVSTAPSVSGAMLNEIQCRLWPGDHRFRML